jgi:hypothetical protein
MPFVSTGAPPVTTWRDTVADPAQKLRDIEVSLDKLRIALARAGFCRNDVIAVDMATRSAITMCAKAQDRKTYGHG